MSVEKYTSYADAFREFRMNISDNDFHDDYPESAEMTLAICSGLRYHYIRNYRSMSADQMIQLIEMFAKWCAKLEQYEDTLDLYIYSRPESMITHAHWFDETNPDFDEWILLCYAYGLITLTPDWQQNICMNIANRNRWAKRNTIQLKLLDRDIKRRNELQQKLNDIGKLVNNIDKFNHIYKYLPTFDQQTGGHSSYNYVIDSYYDGHINEKLGTDTIYEWILNDDVDRFQQWYNDRGLHEYNNVPRGKHKNIAYRENISAHILASNAVKIIRFIIINNIHEFLDDIDGGWALMDPWRQPVNDPECFRLLQERFREEHENIVTEFVDSDCINFITVRSVYRYIRPEIADAIYHEIMEISSRLYGTDNIYLRLYVAVEMAKFGHIGPIESLDWEAVTKTLSDENSYTHKNKYIMAKVAQLIRPRDALISKHRNCLPFGMNPSTAVYIHGLFSENGLDKIDSIGTGLRKQFLSTWGLEDQIDMSSL